MKLNKTCVCLCAGWSFSMGSAYQFHSWRVFVVVCALPCVSAVVALTFMPESPRFYLEVTCVCVSLCAVLACCFVNTSFCVQAGKHDEAWMVLKQIHDTNMRARGEPEKVFTVSYTRTHTHTCWVPCFMGTFNVMFFIIYNIMAYYLTHPINLTITQNVLLF